MNSISHIIEAVRLRGAWSGDLTELQVTALRKMGYSVTVFDRAGPYWGCEVRG